jgi:hypothetical protein
MVHGSPLWHVGCSITHQQKIIDCAERWRTMSQRDANLLWLKDLLSHLENCQRQLEWAEDEDSIHLLTENMVRDLDSCRRICDALRRRARSKSVA